MSSTMKLLVAAVALGGCGRARAQGSEASASSADPPIACQLGALGAEEREHHAALLRELEAMMAEPRETDDGYIFRLRADSVGFRKVAEWITLERRCCPFLSFELGWSAAEESPSLRLHGRPGVKAFLAAEIAGKR